MTLSMTLTKTDKALAELASRQRSLSLKERALLLLADGRRPLRTLLEQVQTTEEVVTRLVADGYLAMTHAAAEVVQAAKTAAPAVAQAAVQALAPAPVAADRFDGQRSLATARMYLFDMVERLFARREPALADELRTALREARDHQAMLEVAHRLLQQVERQAGHERAQAISERLTKLLPSQTLVIY